jgi:AraC-like DNA-binding protein
VTEVQTELVRAASAPESAPAPEVGWAWRRLAESAGGLEVAALAAEVGWSRQHLRTSFRAEYGLTPKVAARLMRFEAARRLVAGPERMSLARGRRLELRHLPGRARTCRRVGALLDDQAS